MAQPEQPPQQEDLPFFLSLIRLYIKRATTAISTAHIMMEGKLAPSQAIIFAIVNASFRLRCIGKRDFYFLETLTVFVSFVASL